MKLQVPFIQLPLLFDAARLADEMDALGPDAWREHPAKYPGNFSLALIAVDGDPDNDEIAGPMRPTPWLARCPYLGQVLGHLGAVWGRTRLMKLAGGAEVTPHVDTNYYWRERMRVHVPITTQPGVRFLCGDAEVHMAAGECWIFDTWRPHRVINVPDRERVHLVADTVGGAPFWQMALRGKAPGQQGHENWRAEFFPGDGSSAPAPLMLERNNVPVVMTPWELREHLQFLFAHTRPDPRLAAIQQSAMNFVASWHALWSRFGEDPDGWPDYRSLLDRFDGWMQANAASLQLVNGVGLMSTWTAMIRKAAFGEQARVAIGGSGRDTSGMAAAKRAAAPRPHGQAVFDRPAFIVSPPRSGSTMLFEALAQSPDLFTIGGESHRLLEREVANGSLGTSARGYESNRLTGDDATALVADEVRERFLAALRDRDGHPPASRVRMLEKTPKNALRVPFLAKVFPDARFVYLYRDPREVLASMLEAWESGRFVTYPDLPGWSGPPWSMVLTPGWRDLIGKPLVEIVATQWETTTRLLLDDFEGLPPEQRMVVRYDHLIADPDAEVRHLCEWLGVRWDRTLESRLPRARYTVSTPRPEKWRGREVELLTVLPRLADTCARAATLSNPVQI